VIMALLVGCALRRNELAELDVPTIQQREGRWVLADLEGVLLLKLLSRCTQIPEYVL
jgi:hypothetical protein